MTASINTFPQAGNSSLDSAINSFAITASDSIDLPVVTRAIYVGVTGDVALLLGNDTVPVTFKAMVAGTMLPLRVKRVMATNTTATNLVGVY